MVLADGCYVLVYNGEVYNFVLLCVELEVLGYGFCGYLDIEVLLVVIS